MCAFPEVKDNIFLEAFAYTDWSNPVITKVLDKPHLYPNLTYQIAYLCYKLDIKMVPFEKEINRFVDIFHYLIRSPPERKFHPDVFFTMALAGEIESPLHQSKEFVEMEDQPYVVEKLLQFGFDPNEPCRVPCVKRPFMSMLYDNEAEGYTPIYFATHLTAPILIKYGASVNLEGTCYQPIDMVKESLRVAPFFEKQTETYDQLIQFKQILLENGAESGFESDNEESEDELQPYY